MKDREHTPEYKELMLRRFLRQKCEEQIKIENARYNWLKIRRKMKVIDLIRYSSGEAVQQLYIEKYKCQGQELIVDKNV